MGKNQKALPPIPTNLIGMDPIHLRLSSHS